MNIGSILKAKRKEKGLTVREVIDQLRKFNIKISDKTLYGWESGYRQPDADTFLILCQIYGVSSLTNLNDIEGKEKPGTAEAVPGKKLSVEERVQFLADFFEKMGFIEPGGDISESDLEFSKAIIDLIAAHFKK